MSDERRRAFIRISPDTIIRMLRAKWIVVCDHDGRVCEVTSTLPADAKALRAWTGTASIVEQGDIGVMFESDSLPPVPEGEYVPSIPITCTERVIEGRIGQMEPSRERP